MDAPYGLVYKPSFPSMQSVFTQMAQMQRLAQKEYAERTKEADKRAYEAMKDLYKFEHEPVIAAYRPYIQEQTASLFSMAGQRGQELEMEKRKVAVLNDVKAINQFSSTADAYIKELKKTGYYKDEELEKIMAEGIYDLTSTDMNGVPTLLPPSKLDKDFVPREIKRRVSVYNQDALAQLFVDNVQKRFNQDLIENEPTNIRGVSNIYKTATLPESMTEINENGKKVVKIDSRKLALWDAQGATWSNYLNARVIAETGDENAVKDGKKRQEVLQKIMNEAGFVDDKKTSELRNVPREETETGKKFDPSKYVTGTAEKDLWYEKEAKVYFDLFSAPQDVKADLAVDLFQGPGVKSVKVLPPDETSKYGYIVIEKEKSFQGINMAQAGSGAKEDDNTVTIELSPKRLRTLSAYANNVRTGDTNPTLLSEMYKKLEGSNQAKLEADFNARWEKALPGEEVRGLDGQYYKKP